MKKLYGILAVCAVLAAAPAAQAAIADFEDLTLAPDSAWTGKDGWPTTNTFTSGGITFYNNDFGKYWEGFAYSNIADGSPSYLSSYPGGGYDSSNYAVVNTATVGSELYSKLWFTPTKLGTTDPAQATFAPQEVQGFNIANTQLTHSAINALKSWGVNDAVTLSVYGLDKDGAQTPTSPVTYKLASFQNDKLNILNGWDWVDLTSLGAVYGLEFKLTSELSLADSIAKCLGTGTVTLGEHVPQTFAMDNLTVGAAAPVPVPAAAWLLGAGLLGLVGVRRRSAR